MRVILLRHCQQENVATVLTYSILSLSSSYLKNLSIFSRSCVLDLTKKEVREIPIVVIIFSHHPRLIRVHNIMLSFVNMNFWLTDKRVVLFIAVLAGQ
jgi:hypothetical protein